MIQENNNTQTATQDGSAADQQQNPGGTTNLSLEQLKEAHAAGETTGDNPDQINDEDDLHEIQADDDLNEPSADEDLAPTGASAEDEAGTEGDLDKESAENPENNS